MSTSCFFSDGPRPPTASLCLPAQTHAEAHQVPASSQGDRGDVGQDDYVDDVDQDDYVEDVDASSQGDRDDVDQDDYVESVDGDNVDYSQFEKYRWLWRNSKMW